MSQRYERIAETLQVQPMLEALAEHPELWALHTARQATPGSPHTETETIIVRWPEEHSVWAAFYDLTCVDYPATIEALMPALGQLILDVLAYLGLDHARADIGRVLVVRLKPGGRVAPHVDTGPYADRYDRFHVVLQAEDYDVLTVEGEAHACRPGELFWFNHKREHHAHNFSEVTPRIHLIFDVVAPQYRAKRGLTFQRERLIDLWDEVLPLLVEHKEEIAHYPDLALDVDYVTYEAQDAGGVMRAYTARLNGALVGYSAFFVRHNLHYKASLQAINDVLFVQAAHRHGRVGLQLIRFCEAELQREGVQVVFQHLKAASTQTCALFDRLGYETIDVIKGKRLDR